MKKNLTKPYILYVAEVIYLEICAIKSKEKNINNNIFLSPKIDSLFNILNSIINKNDDKKEKNS